MRALTGDDGRALDAGAREQLLDVGAHELEPLLVGEVGLRERDDAALDAEQVDDREVLARLRHDAVVGGDHEQHDVDAGRAGDHLAHELLVAGHVDDAHRAPARQLELREAELDGDAALLLLRQAVGIGAGERLDERGLAVVDVPGGAENERGVRGHRRATPRSTSRETRDDDVAPRRRR